MTLLFFFVPSGSTARALFHAIRQLKHGTEQRDSDTAGIWGNPPKSQLRAVPCRAPGTTINKKLSATFRPTEGTMETARRDLLMNAGIDVDDLVARCMDNVPLAERLLQKFSLDGNYRALCQAVQDGDRDKALQAAHGLKGVCGNLSMTVLHALLTEQVLAMRSGDWEKAERLMPEIVRKHEEVTVALQKAFS